MAQESAPSGEVFIVDDDPAVREVLSMVFAQAGFRPTCFADGAALLAGARLAVPACIILDVNIPGRSGLDILKQLNAEDYPAPIFVISGEGDIPMAVSAIRSGALDFIEKPFRGLEVVERIKESIVAWARRQQESASSGAAALAVPGREPFTRRERDVLNLILAGASSKEAGRKMGISPRTVEFHRARIMEKVDAKNTADLIRIVMSRHSQDGSGNRDVEPSI
ncbi:MAG TPA: response regulator [Xanthobacteraceae bacterium]|jgi:FixJ family two-component response regulator|nr:response regulator [Xanthobacteraceae bacterium]